MGHRTHRVDSPQTTRDLKHQTDREGKGSEATFEETEKRQKVVIKYQVNTSVERP